MTRPRNAGRLPTGPDIVPVNDMDVIVRVLQDAVALGFLVVGTSRDQQFVVRRVAGQDREVERAGALIGRAVTQSLATGLLTLGGYHTVAVRVRGVAGPTVEARSVLVPDPTKKTVARWSSLIPLPRNISGEVQ